MPRGHMYTAREMWSAHGWPIIESLAGTRSMPDIFHNSTHSGLQKLLGNGWHLTYTATFFFWCLSNITPRSRLESLSTDNSRIDKPEDEGEDDEPLAITNAPVANLKGPQEEDGVPLSADLPFC